MTHNNVWPHTVCMQHRTQAKPDGLHSRQIDLATIQPARIIFAKARGLDEGKLLVVGSVWN